MRKRGACDVHRGAREAICKRGAHLRPIGASQGERGEPSGAPECGRGAPLDVHRAPQCKRGVSLMSIGAPGEPYGRLHAKEGAFVAFWSVHDV